MAETGDVTTWTDLRNESVAAANLLHDPISESFMDGCGHLAMVADTAPTRSRFCCRQKAPSADEPGEARQDTRTARTGIPRGQSTAEFLEPTEVADLRCEREPGCEFLRAVRGPLLGVDCVVVGDRSTVGAVPAIITRCAGAKDAHAARRTHQDRPRVQRCS